MPTALRSARYTTPLLLGGLAALLGFPGSLHAQPALQPIPLDDLSAFVVPEAGRWQIVGGVRPDPSGGGTFVTTSGGGVLVNLPGEDHGADIRTEMEHGDLELALDFMMAEGSNSGIYLQGRYEIQLLDSWGEANPTYGDCGGLYERWDEKRGEGREGYEGRAPRLNACGAPGLWQHLELSFQAPRFGPDGNKVENARLLYVRINGVTVHENVELTGPTRGPLVDGGIEVPEGPLRFQGDHGPVAFRDIRYAAFDPAEVELSDLSYELYAQPARERATLDGLRPERQGAAPELSWKMAGPPALFTLLVDGQMEVPTSGAYTFDPQTNWAGALALTIDGRPVEGGEAVELEAGAHPFELLFAKLFEGGDPVMGVYVEGPGVRRQPLHAQGSIPVTRPPNPIYVEADVRPKVVRGFARLDSSRHQAERLITHAVFAGHPAGAHYVFDGTSGALAEVWRGPFLDATPMWEGRGGNPPDLIGNALVLGAAPPLAPLVDSASAWPDSVGAGDFRLVGYELEDGGYPVFRYRLYGADVADRIRPSEDGKTLVREIRVEGEGRNRLYLRVAAGDSIEAWGNGTYAVDDQRYLVRLPDGLEPVLRQNADGRDELLVPLGSVPPGAEVRYEIVW